MPKLNTGRSQRSTSAWAVVIGVLAVGLATASGTAQAAVPKLGVWESTSLSEPRVAFDVLGSPGSRIVDRVSFPMTCKGSPLVIGWGTTTRILTRAGGRRFTAYDFGSVIRGRFTAANRAEVTVRSYDGGTCRATRRYALIHRGRQLAVPSGRYLSLVGAGTPIELDTTAFGRVVEVAFMDGSMPADCSDGSHRALPLAGPDGDALVAPVRLNGRFDMTATAAGSSITIEGSFDSGSVAAFVFLSVVLPDGTRCTARPQPLVGAMAFPLPTGIGEGQEDASEPVIPIHLE